MQVCELTPRHVQVPDFSEPFREVKGVLGCGSEIITPSSEVLWEVLWVTQKQNTEII